MHGCTAAPPVLGMAWCSATSGDDTLRPHIKSQQPRLSLVHLGMANGAEETDAVLHSIPTGVLPHEWCSENMSDTSSLVFAIHSRPFCRHDSFHPATASTSALLNLHSHFVRTLYYRQYNESVCHEVPSQRHNVSILWLCRCKVSSSSTCGAPSVEHGCCMLMLSLLDRTKQGVKLDMTMLHVSKRGHGHVDSQQASVLIGKAHRL